MASRARRIGWAVLLVLLGLGVALLVVRDDLAVAFPAPSPVGEAVAPDDPRVRLESAAASLRAHHGEVTPEIATQAAEAFRTAPLAPEPFLIFGAQAANRDDTARAIRLLEEARRREPRMEYARLLLLDRYIRASRIEAATREVIVLQRLIPDEAALLLGGLAGLAVQPETRAQVAQVIGTSGAVRDGLLSFMIDRSFPIDSVIALANAGPARATSPDGMRWRAALLHTLIEQNRVADARLLWARYSGLAAAPEGVYDPSFRGLPGPPPFNWELASGGIGSTDRARGSGLEVTYFGRDSGALASQLLLLRPGRYRFMFVGQGNASPQGSGLEWRLACRTETPSLLQLPLRGLNFAPRQQVVEFTVPAQGCAEQWLRLYGVAAEFPTEQDIRIGRVDVQPLGNGS